MTSDRSAGKRLTAFDRRLGPDRVGRTSPTDPAASAEGEGRSLTLDDLGIRPHNCFACGELNACGMRLPLHFEPGRCWTELSLGDRFEGWEGVIHGGVLSTILDEVMGWALMEADSWGVTARLAVTYRAPVIPGQPIRAEGWITARRRRVQRTAARIVDQQTGAELVTAEAVYVSATESRKRQLQDRYGFFRGDRPESEQEGGTWEQADG